MRFYVFAFIALMFCAWALVDVEPMKPNPAIPAFSEVMQQPRGFATITPPPPQPFEFVSGCNFPGTADNAQLILLSKHEGQYLSSVTLGSQHIAVTAGNLVVEDGDQPLDIVLISSEPAIWQVSGAVGRVHHLILASSSLYQPEGRHGGFDLSGSGKPALAGATGLPADKVRVLGNNRCLHAFTDPKSPEAAVSVDAMRHYMNRSPDIIASAEHVGNFSVPSGGVSQASTIRTTLIGSVPSLLLEWIGQFVSTDRLQIMRDMAAFHPGGVMTIDPGAVISHYASENYRVLPEEAGMLQLLKNGDLTTDQMGAFNIVGPITFPAGLTGAHSHHFILAKGVPLPLGAPGHSCVTSQETGEVLLSDGIC